jgi:hypothetical protein
MEILHRSCAGIDIGKRSVTVCVITTGPAGETVKEWVGTFSPRRPSVHQEFCQREAHDGVDGRQRLQATKGGQGVGGAPRCS